MRPRTAALWPASLDARSLHAPTIHSAVAATMAMTPNTNTTWYVTRPITMRAPPRAATAGHMLAAGAGAPAGACRTAATSIDETLASRM